MKKFFQKFNSYSFWVSLSSAMLILIQAIGTPAGLEISEEIYMSVVNSVLGVFVLLGIVPKPTSKTEEDKFFRENSSDANSLSNTQDSTQNLESDTLALDENERELLISYQRTNT
ncbi:MAG: hypothetical protein IKQ31_02895 [Clostridia bacterium]|nr:hypothetical protein [Clostridia bacterium]